MFAAQVHRTSGDCAWQATTDGISEIVGFAGGTGDGAFAFRVLPTPGDYGGYVGVRWTGGVALLGFRQTTEACGGDLLPDSIDVDPKGGTFTYMVAFHVACSYVGVADVDWLSSTRDGTAVSAGNLRVTVAPNSSPAARSGALSVFKPFQSPKTMTVTQSGS